MNFKTDKKNLSNQNEGKEKNFIHKIKIVLIGLLGNKEDDKTIQVKISTPIGIVAIIALIILANFAFIGDYFILKTKVSNLEKKVSNEWTDVVSVKQDLENLAKLQKTTAPSIESYKKAIDIITNSNVSYSQISPTNELLSIDLRGQPNDLMNLLDEFKKSKLNFSRKNVSYQMNTKDGVSVSEISMTIEISPM